jgi:Spy/CpxP family protein refolding chaperone
MKLIIGALALFIAAPVAGQNAPAANPRAGHAEHQTQQQHGNEHEGPAGHSEHQMNCCDKMKQDAGQKDCCAQHAREHSGKREGHTAE